MYLYCTGTPAVTQSSSMAPVACRLKDRLNEIDFLTRVIVHRGISVFFLLLLVLSLPQAPLAMTMMMATKK